MLHDPRPPIVFLRSFKDDQVELEERSWTPLKVIFGLGRGRSPLDHLLIEEFSQIGPVVAIGRPGEKLPPFGAWRTYVDNTNGEQWKIEVADLVRRARAVVMVADDTAGVLWEVQHLAKEGHLLKTLFLAPPRFAEPKLNKAMWEAVAANIGLASSVISEIPGRRTLAFVGSGQDGGNAVLSRRFTRSDYLMALRWFFRSELGT